MATAGWTWQSRVPRWSITARGMWAPPCGLPSPHAQRRTCCPGAVHLGPDGPYSRPFIVPQVADLDGDGLRDLVLVDRNYRGGANLRVLRGQHGGTPVLEGEYPLQDDAGGWVRQQDVCSPVLPGSLQGKGQSFLVHALKASIGQRRTTGVAAQPLQPVTILGHHRGGCVHGETTRSKTQRRTANPLRWIAPHAPHPSSCALAGGYHHCTCSARCQVDGRRSQSDTGSESSRCSVQANVPWPEWPRQACHASKMGLRMQACARLCFTAR